MKARLISIAGRGGIRRGSGQLAASAGDVWVLYPLDPANGRLWMTLLWFVIALAGVVVQLSTSKKKKKASVAKLKK